MPIRRVFLRSDRSLIQTIGRAARHINGRAILYADNETGSMTRAMAETERRRNKQLAFNEENNITPKGIHKSVQDILEGARRMPTKARGGKSRPAAGDRASLSAEVSHLTPAALGRKITDMEQKMLEHAKNLEFEEAAALRDEVAELKTSGLRRLTSNHCCHEVAGVPYPPVFVLVSCGSSLGVNISGVSCTAHGG
ncbi:MAG: hypothetical protein CM15mP74_03170 [Halieaceae bacterium]|nr:MAG: hypothetical protein CM15mP74_03170 [Halieaceae bacterium]